jgi:hypothetical protein
MSKIPLIIVALLVIAFLVLSIIKYEELGEPFIAAIIVIVLPLLVIAWFMN